MRMRFIFVVVVLFVVGIAVGFFLRGGSVTGNVVDNLGEYSYTRAVCSGNKCIDVVVFCESGDVVDIEPVIYLVEHEEGWEDPRGVGEFCE